MNRNQKKGIYFILFIICFFSAFIYFKAPSIQAVQGPTEKNIPILCYHRVITKPTSPYDLTPEQLEAHFQFFKANGYTPITISQYLAYRKKPALFPEKPIVLTFDDGSKSQYVNVLPLLKKYAFKATFYIFTNATHGTRKLWLSWDEIAEILRDGMEIGSHTISHPYLTSRGKMNDDQYKVWLEKEVTQSKKILEEKLNTRITTLAYPFGLYNQEIESAAIQAGYSGMLTLNMGLNQPHENPFRMKRRLMVNSIGPKSLKIILSEKVLDLEVLSPEDTVIINSLPVIRFRLKTPLIETVRVEISKYQSSLKPDAQGIYSFTIPGKLRTGFQMITVRGSDKNNNSYLNSWSFYYKPNEKTVSK